MEDDYIPALEAANALKMSPGRFANLLRKERERLPVTIDYEGALQNHPFAMFAARALEKFYAMTQSGDGFLYALKIHRLDWEEFLREREAAKGTGGKSTGSNKDMARIKATRQACETVREEIKQGKHGFQVKGEYKINCAYFQDSVKALLGDTKVHRNTLRDEWAKVPKNIKHFGRVPDQ